MTEKGYRGKRVKESALFARKKILKAAREGNAAPVYCFHGAEEYLVEDTAVRLISILVPDAADIFSREILSGTEITREEVGAALETLSLFGGAKVVWLRGCGLFRSPEWAAFTSDRVPEAPGSLTVVITEASVDKRMSLYKKIARVGVTQEFDAFDATKDTHLRSLYDIAKAKLARDGKEISREAFFLLVELAGSDLRTLLAEIEKLSLHAGDAVSISIDEVNTMVSPKREAVAFQLSDIVSEKKVQEACAFLTRLLEQAVAPIAIQRALLKRMRFLLQGKEAMEKGMISTAVVSRGYPAFKKRLSSLPPTVSGVLRERKGHNLFSQHPYVAFRVCRSAAKQDVDSLRWKYNRALEAERDLKGGRRSPEEALEDCVIDLCR